MRIQINREKLTSLNELLKYLLKEFPAGDESESLIDDKIKNINRKLEERIATTNNKNSYSVSIPEAEAMALFSYITELTPMIPKTFYVFEQKVSQEILNQIDETYGTLKHAS